MKAIIILFLAWSFSSNIVVCYHPFPGYRQGAYPQQNDWSHDQHYPQNPNSGFLHQQPAPINYAPSQHVPKYQQSTYEKTSQHQVIESENSELNRTDVIYDEQPANPPQQTYLEDQTTQHLAQPERNYDNYGVAPQSWQNAPPNRVYHERYPAPVPHVQTSWTANAYPSAPIISQESYPPRPTYPHWQSNAYQNVPPTYYSNPYDGQIIYNNQAPVQQPSLVLVPPPPQAMPALPPPPPPQSMPSPPHRTPHTSAIPPPRPSPAVEPAPEPESEQTGTQTWTQASSVHSEKNNVRETVASKQEVKEYLESTPAKKRFLLVRPNGTIEHVDVVDDSLLNNSQNYKTSDLLSEQERNKNLQHSNENKYHDISVHKPIRPSLTKPDTYKNQNRNLEPINNNDYAQLNNPHDTNPTSWPVKEEPSKNYNPRFNYMNKKKPLELNTNLPVDLPPVPAPNNNNYRPNLPHNQPNEKPYNNPKHDWNNPPSNDWNIHKPQKSKTDIIITVNKNDFEKEKKRESVYNLDQNRFNNYPHFDQTNFESSSTKPLIKPFENNNFYRNPIFGQAPIHPKYPINKHPLPANDNHQNFAINNYPKNPNPIIEQKIKKNPENVNNIDVVTNNDRNPAVYTTTESPDALLVDTEKPYYYTGPTFVIPNNNNNNDTETFEQPPPKDYENFILELNNQAQTSDTLDSNDDTSSIVQSYPGNENPTSEKYTDDGFISNYPVEQGDRVYDDADVDNPDKPNDSVVPSESETNNSEGNYVSPPTDGDVPEDSQNEGYLEDDIATITADKQQETKPESMYPTDEDNNTEQKETGINEVAVADLEDLKKVDKPVFWYRPTEEFWDKLYSEADTGGYDRLFVFNVKVVDPIIEKSSKSYVFENGTTVEETTEILWENKDDELPREVRITKIIRNPGPEVALPKRPSFKPNAYASDTPKCKTCCE